ncbi:MAG TPA: family 1 encapsulin nanocompartment shell protein [Acidimicrobiales bacterium]|nr:family 1 encapsulin nanocompartment shell protein [Acidimicrobiales bacterium]
MDHLLRDQAPISSDGWQAIDQEAKARLTTYLAARKLVDFVGPNGWSHSATNLGRVTKVTKTPTEGVTARQRRVLPLVELRAEFTVSRTEIDDVDRGAADVDLADLDQAARRIALGENVAVFHGYNAAGIKGIVDASSHKVIDFNGEFERSPTVVAKAVDVLRQSGIDGPYGLAIGPAGYTGIIETTEHGGLLLLDHLRQILGGPVIWAPGVEGGVVLSLRGGDFVLDCGQDLSIGYLDHDADRVRLYFEESISFRVVEPDAAVPVRLVRS